MIFAVNHRPVQGTRGTYRVAMRHGVSELRSGSRHTLGVILHDAAGLHELRQRSSRRQRSPSAVDAQPPAEPHQPRRDFLAARAAHPRRDDAARLEAELLEHPRRGRVVEEVRAFEAGRPSVRAMSISAAQASVAKPRPQRARAIQ